MRYNFKKIGERIREQRKKTQTEDNRKYTQDDLCEKIDMSRNTLSDLEQGKRCEIKLSQLIEMADLFDCSINYLLCETDYRNNEKEVAGKLLNLSPEAIDNLANMQNHGMLKYGGEGINRDYGIDSMDLSKGFLNQMLANYPNILNEMLNAIVRSLFGYCTYKENKEEYEKQMQNFKPYMKLTYSQLESMSDSEKENFRQYLSIGEVLYILKEIHPDLKEYPNLENSIMENENTFELWKEAQMYHLQSIKENYENMRDYYSSYILSINNLIVEFSKDIDLDSIYDMGLVWDEDEYSQMLKDYTTDRTTGRTTAYHRNDEK